MKRLGFTLTFGILAIILQAQPYTIDSSFLPYFDIRTNTPYGGRVADVWENPKNGKLFIVGDFDIRENGIPIHDGFTQTFINGNYSSSFSAIISGSNLSSINSINDTMFALTKNSFYNQLDSLGAPYNNGFNVNFYYTLRCITGSNPYFFPDGSSLMANYRGGKPNSCQIYSYNDTFPHQYIVKLNPQGLYDSSFQASPNTEPEGFIKYDSSRILVYGLARSFTHYNGKTINGLCRIYHDGTLDTTFSSPLSPANQNNFFEIRQINSDGSFFINGSFLLKNDTPNKYRYLVKIKPNGEIDSSFNYTFNLILNALPTYGIIRTIAATPDGGYLVGGGFDSYDGYVKRNIVKIDSVGNVEPQYFLGAGPDSSGQNGSGLGGVIGIKASKFGGYYVYGDFLKWDGQPSQPIVRIHDLLTGVESQKPKAESLELYPNPSNGIINISNFENIESIRIYNLQGQLIKKLKSRQKQFELPEQTGMYIIQVEDEKGNVFTKKIVKNNY